MDPEKILVIQYLFLGGITIGYHSGAMDAETLQRYTTSLAHFAVCLLVSQGLELTCLAVYNYVHTRELPKFELKDKFKNSLYILVLSVSYLMFQKHSLLGEEFVMLLMASAGVRYLESKRQSATITYGEGMACSYAEGYLYVVLPPDGAQYAGLEGQLRAAEAAHRVAFPARRLLLVVTKSLFCPPNLEAFNKNDEALPRVEALTKHLGELELDVAGVQRRVYRNTAYKISGATARPVHVVAECATPLHTLWKVLQKRAVYQNTNPDENLAEVLIAKVRELEPNFENITRN